MLLLHPGRVEIVVDDVLAEDLHRRIGPLQFGDRLVQCPRHPRDVLCEVTVAFELGLEREPVLDAIEPAPIIAA